MSALLQHIRFAARGLARQPGLVLAVVLTLALGIGGNTAIFSVVDSALLVPPPFRDPGRLVVAWASNPGLAQSAGLADKLPVSYGDFYDWRRQSRALELLSLVQPATMALTGRGDPQQLDVVRVTGDFSLLLATPPALGCRWHCRPTSGKTGRLGRRHGCRCAGELHVLSLPLPLAEHDCASDPNSVSVRCRDGPPAGPRW